ncbi:DUF3107 domain-containing protein [Saxibacter everestensis]|uniref:DUF3107 domain-containing protein n=1 Tax=Saxibacter everestensis TaxID=2909229 RepID=A0ABY8QQU2_9MICO|nr:DUF3107 domain-containing protein [Brevibacteriaceae bacterium ZFBP1038]
MEIKIGVQNAPRELVLESNMTADDVYQAVSEAVESRTVLRLVDEKGRQVVVPAGVLGYVETGSEESRRVGFGPH